MKNFNTIYLQMFNPSTTTKPKPDILTGIDTGTLWELGLGLGLALGIGLWWKCKSPRKNNNDSKIINIDFTLDKFYGNTMWNYDHFIIYIFDVNPENNMILLSAYSKYIITQNIEGVIEFTIIGSCSYKGKRIDHAIGFAENYRVFP